MWSRASCTRSRRSCSSQGCSPSSLRCCE
jgi:hypothetical protein